VPDEFRRRSKTPKPATGKPILQNSSGCFRNGLTAALKKRTHFGNSRRGVSRLTIGFSENLRFPRQGFHLFSDLTCEAFEKDLSPTRNSIPQHGRRNFVYDKSNVYDNSKVMGDVTLLRILLCDGDQQVSQDAAAEFCARYMEKLISLVERNLSARFAARFSPEDVVQSVFRSWFADAKQGQIKAATRDEIWKLISTIALNKVRNRIKHHSRGKRDIRRTEAGDELFPSIASPTPEDAATVMDVIQTASLRLDENSRRTLELILQGRSHKEIAEILGRTTKSIGRYRDRIAEALRSVIGEKSESFDAE
jgi:RNA polymerase sigma factor (sigma-70 family)